MMVLSALGMSRPDGQVRAPEDPWETVIRFCVRAGTAMVFSGVLLSAVAYFSKAQSQRSLSDAASEGATITGQFNNLSYNPEQSPYLPINTGNAVGDLSNFGNDTWRFFKNVGNDVSALGGLISNALKDLWTALLNIAAHGPTILFNELVGRVLEGVSDILIWVFPWLIWLGALLLAVGLSLRLAKKYLVPRATLVFHAAALPVRERLEGLVGMARIEEAALAWNAREARIWALANGEVLPEPVPAQAQERAAEAGFVPPVPLTASVPAVGPTPMAVGAEERGAPQASSEGQTQALLPPPSPPEAPPPPPPVEVHVEVPSGAMRGDSESELQQAKDALRAALAAQRGDLPRPSPARRKMEAFREAYSRQMALA